MTYYKTCPDCEGKWQVYEQKTSKFWYCPTCVPGGYAKSPGLVPVAEGAIIIEDRDAAIERMRQITSAWADSDYWASAISAEDASELLDAAGGERT